MNKYIIELDDRIKLVTSVGVTENGVVYTTSDYVHNLEELNSDYINENFGELQDEAYQRGHDDGYEAGCATAFKPVSDAEYQRGFEDGKKSTEKGCEGCKYESYGDTEDPCWHCRKSYKDKYEPAPHSDRIKVGDEVIWSDGTTIIVTIVYADCGLNWCDGVSKDGRACHVLLNNVRKTGKHYDIQSILEAMRK